MALELLLIFAALALGGLVKGVTGAGVPVVAVPVLAAFFDVPFAIAMMIVPTIVTNLVQMWQFRRHRSGPGYLVWMFVLAGVGIAAGTWLLTELPEAILGNALGVVVVLYIALRLSRPDWRLAPATARRLAPAAGLASGLLQGATGISAPVSITFLNAIGLTRGGFVFAISTLFVSFAAVQLPALVLAGILTGERALLSAAALVPVLLAMPVGGWLAARLTPRGFDRVILALLAVIAVKLFYDSGLIG
jgi:hypothetical protein